MRILITGATGLVGNALTFQLLQNGHSVHYLTTSKKKITNGSQFRGFYWNPEQGIIDENALIGVDVIVHLAGATVSKRWTKTYKEEILESRTLSANLLYRTLKANPHQVKEFVSASAIGIYPDNLTKLYNEDSPEIGDDFLANVVVKWEESVDKFRELGINTAKVRTGLVLSSQGGALPEMLKTIKLGVGAAFGSGKQMQSWIHIDDLAAIYYFIINNDLQGVFNAVAPNPVTNQELTTALAKMVHKPLFMPNIPKFLMSMILGEMHTLLFSSQKVSAAKIEGKGFVFKYPLLEKALTNLT